MNIVWYRHPTKANAYQGERHVAEVRPAPEGVYTSNFEVEIFGVTRRGCASIDDGIGMARVILAGLERVTP
jgi:hypothetical protein